MTEEVQRMIINLRVAFIITERYVKSLCVVLKRAIYLLTGVVKIIRY